MDKYIANSSQYQIKVIKEAKDTLKEFREYIKELEKIANDFEDETMKAEEKITILMNLVKKLMKSSK